MSDLTDLRDAFTELERRADVHPQTELAVRPAAASTVRPGPEHRPARRRPVLIGATVAVLLAGAAGAVTLTHHSERAATPLVDGQVVTSASGSASPGPTVSVATSTAELEDRFRAALAGVATFTVTQRVEDRPTSPAPGPVETTPGSTSSILASSPPAPTDIGSAGASATSSPGAPPAEQDGHNVLIGGVLTAAGRGGGYDVQTAADWSGPAFCESEDACEMSTLADGSSLAVATSSVPDANGNLGGGTTYEVCLVRPDGVLVLFHLDNELNPKGGSGQLSTSPPLTTAQMTAIVTSPVWVTG